MANIFRLVTRGSRQPMMGVQRAGAPKTAPHAQAAPRHGGGPSSDVSPQMQRYLNQRPIPVTTMAVPRERIPFAIALGLASVYVCYHYFSAPANQMTEWADDEAAERARRRVLGLPVEYGMNYAGLRRMNEAATGQPALTSGKYGTTKEEVSAAMAQDQ